MNIIQDVIKTEAELSATQRDEFAKKLAGNFSKWDEDRNSQITTALEIMQEVYLNQPSRRKKGQEWKSDVKLNGLYNIKKALTSQLWHQMYGNPSSMFDVRGTSQETEDNAKIQKAGIVDSLEKGEVGKQMDDGINNLFDIGEVILKTDWLIKTKKVMRRGEFGLQEMELPVYENARVESISPFMFVFDHAKYKLRNKDSWDSITKIYKRFDTLENIKANKNYTITKQQLFELSQEKESKSVESEKADELRKKDEYGSEYSVLFAHGDFKINGKIYKNYIAEVLAGKYLIRFEKNPVYINPFILCALEYDPKTKRGISKLKAVINMCKEEEELTNVAFDIQKLTANPVLLAGEDMFDEDNTEKDGTIEYYPGKVIKFKEGLSANQMPIPVTINGNGISDLLMLLGQKIADTSTVSAVMYGNIEAEKRTATELSLADKGSATQTGKDLDIIYQDLTIPMIKNVAELRAMFVDGVERIYTEEKGKALEFEVTNAIRQAQYHYYYEDRNAITERKQKFQDLYQLASGCAQLPELAQRINFEEIAKTGFENIGYENVEKFFKEATPVDKFGEQLKQIPPQMQGQVVQMFSQQLGQMMQQYQMQQQQAQMQAQAQRQVEMQAMRDNARANMENQFLAESLMTQNTANATPPIL